MTTTYNLRSPYHQLLIDILLEQSFRLEIETVPTLIRYESGAENGRTIGWYRQNWEVLTG